jgi:hypothetical protein
MAPDLHFHFRLDLDEDMPNKRTTTDDLENRQISAAKIHGVHPERAYGGGTDRGARDHCNTILDYET